MLSKQSHTLKSFDSGCTAADLHLMSYDHGPFRVFNIYSSFSTGVLVSRFNILGGSGV
jgi:hypothetical protein